LFSGLGRLTKRSFVVAATGSKAVNMSVFTFEPDHQRVSSPWQQDTQARSNGPTSPPLSTSGSTTGSYSLLSEYSLTSLPPEPQDGPIEYKLHLLLRPRKVLNSSTTGFNVGGSQHVSHGSDAKPARPNMVALASSSQNRQDRCQQLSTQLLWRLRQSSSDHRLALQQGVTVPPLPDESTILSVQPTLAKLAPGLEESRGALYEIGVQDDGRLVGITKDEMDQSIATLRWMAANLGCAIQVLRKVIVGHCEWSDDTVDSDDKSTYVGYLWVAEVLVSPDFSSREDNKQLENGSHVGNGNGDRVRQPAQTTPNQLRVTLTGSTGSGKSSLLGTITTGALDDGHGKTRLNALKHLHEVASGLTSSVTQELIGYNGDAIVNLTNPNIADWTGIHDYTRDGRLALISDSAGHPRYRRTFLRGIVGWAPHWTFLCVAADHTGGSSGIGTPTLSAQDALGSTVTTAEWTQTQFELCLKLELPLVIVITKLDLVTRESLRQTLAPMFAAAKAAGRTICVLRSKVKIPEGLRSVPLHDDETVRSTLSDMESKGDFLLTIPAVLTSAVTGDGIGLIHAILKDLPLPPAPTSHDLTGVVLNPEQPAALFHVEDLYNRPATYATVSTGQKSDVGVVVSGYMRFGTLSIGDIVVVGPFPPEDEDIRGTPDGRSSPSHLGLSMSNPSSSELGRLASRNAISASAIKGEWHNAEVVSIRNLRLPVQTLQPGQVGTVGLVFKHIVDASDGTALNTDQLSNPKPRKGQVVAIPSKHMVDSGLQLQAASGLTAHFTDSNITSLTVGTNVTIYVASVRAQARIVSMSAAEPVTDAGFWANENLEDEIFDMSEDEPRNVPHVEASGFDVKFELYYGREWLELGSHIVILEGASKAGSLLGNLIGKVIEVVD